MNPRVKKVIPLSGHRIQLTFTNGEVGVYDCSDLLGFGVFRELADEAYFAKVHVLRGTVCWPHEQDICPDTLYEDSERTLPQRTGVRRELAGCFAVHETAPRYGATGVKPKVPGNRTKKRTRPRTDS